MKPGPELDRRMAEKVMGIQPCSAHGTIGCCTPLWPYSTSIAHAWEVAEKSGCLRYPYALHQRRDGTWEVTEFVGSDTTHSKVFASGDTAPHAICLAALKAVGGAP